MTKAGRHPHKALTAQTIRTTTTPGRYADGGGLYLLVAPGGSKSWVLRTLVKGRRQRCDVGLGGLGLVSLAEARDEAHRLRRIARAGGDPLLERRRARRATVTFKAAAEAVHTEHAKTFKNAKHAAQWLQSLENDVFPTIGPKPIDQVDTADVLKVLTPIWTTKPETARRLKQRIKVVFDWAKASGHRTGDNPTDGLTKVLPKQRGAKEHHAALPYQALPAFLQGLHESDAGEVVKLALEFTILCATRTSETLHAEWTEIDLTAKTWTIPGARMKAGLEHRVPLSARCITLLERAKALSGGGPYVFPGRSPRKPLSNMVFLMTLRRMGRSDITAHGFRSTFRDWAAERTNVPRSVCEAALAHTLRDKTEAAYHRTDLFDRRRNLMNAWAKFATPTPADVVTLRR